MALTAEVLNLTMDPLLVAVVEGENSMDEIFEEDETPLEKSFNKAAEHLKSLVDKLDKQELLFFYSRFKQATVGQCDKKRPGMFDFQGRQKWDAWSKLGSMSKEDAMLEYTDRMDDVDENWRDSKDSKGGLGVGVSTMCNNEEVISEDDKTIFDWCKEGNVDMVQRLLTNPAININDLDENGLALIHWASDRGWVEIIELLSRLEADMNLADVDGQTPLHYAATCEHIEVIETLLKNGADPTLEDDDGLLPADNTDSKQILDLLVEHSHCDKT